MLSEHHLAALSASVALGVSLACHFLSRPRRPPPVRIAKSVNVEGVGEVAVKQQAGA